jgi:hypothetical protein
MKKTNQGGVRSGAGRKPIPDKKVIVPVYIPTSIVEKMGGKEKCRDAIVGFIYKATDAPEKN